MAKFKRRIWHQTVIIAIIPLMLSGFLFSTLFYLVGDVQDAAKHEEQATEFANEINQSMTAAADAAVTVRDYWSSKDLRYCFDYQIKLDRAIARQEKHILSSDNPLERKFITTHLKLLMALNNETSTLAAQMAEGVHIPEFELLGKARRIIKMMTRMNEYNHQSLIQISDDLQKLETTIVSREDQARQLISTGFALCLVVSLVLALIVRHSIVGRIISLRQYVDAVIRGKSIPVPVGGTDEIAELEASFAYMSSNIRDAIRREQAAMQGADVFCALRPDGTIHTSNAEKFEVGKGLSDYFALADQLSFNTSLQQARQTLDAVAVETGSISWSCNWSSDEQLFYCVGHDISELKQREEALRANRERIAVLMQSMPAALFVVNDQGEITRVNEESASLLAEPAAVLVGASLKQYGEFNSGNRSSVRRSDGSRVWCDVIEDEFDDEHLIIALNVNERIKMEQMRDRLKAMIAHDIGAPLTAIQATFKSLERGRYGQISDTGMQKAAVGIAETTRLIELFQDFLAIEKHNANEWSLTFESIDLAEVVGQAAAAVQTLADKANVSLAVDAAPATVRGDRNKLVQLFVNLLSNALKFTPANSTVHLKLEDAGDKSIISVRDEGPGIPAHLLNAIFEPFKQTTLTDSTVKGGSGLGLAICKSIVSSHRGTITARNNTAGGAKFLVELPKDPEV